VDEAVERDASGRADAEAAPLDDAGDIRPDERFDEARLEAWLREAIPGVAGPLAVRQFRGGHANLTYLLRAGEREMVLRRPPLGPVAPRSHDMAREFRALSALAPLYAPAPQPLALCEDTSVVGAVFFVMERRRGIVIRGEWPGELGGDPGLRRRIGLAVVDALADLHRIDVRRPEIAALGKPRGFVERQLRGWWERWLAAKTRELAVMDELYAWLCERLPSSDAVSVLHNDWKLDNTMLDAGDPGRVAAVFDWDMTSLGDPLVDLGTFLGYWSEPGDDVPRGTGSMVTSLPGFPTRAELAERYAERTGADLSQLRWYETFGLFKTAVVLEQIYVRFVRGQTQDERFERLGRSVPLLAEAARRTAGR
jgi:aminoglycoside phosphotransferase (APT) family kinase protein